MSWCLTDYIPLVVVNSIILEYSEFEVKVLLSLILPDYNASYWKGRRYPRYETSEDIDRDVVISILCGQFKPSRRIPFTPLHLPDLQYLVYHCVYGLPVTYEACISLVKHDTIRSCRYYLTQLILTPSQYLSLVMEIGLGSRQYFQSYLDINTVLSDYGNSINVSVEELNARYSYHTVWLRMVQTAPNIAMKYVLTPGLRLRTLTQSAVETLWHSLISLKLKSDSIDLKISRLYTDAIKTVIALDPDNMKEWQVIRQDLKYDTRYYIDMIES